jgi:threonine/homoserine/homoserine lactone efflux protein
MTLTTLFAMFTLSLVMSISPGPVNMMIITSGINKGFVKTFPFISGATIGFTLLLIFVAFGFSTILSDYPSFLTSIGIIGGLFIMYMGYKIATSTPNLALESRDKNLKFYEGFLLQWLNPKAWIATISGVSLFSTNNLSLIVFIIIYFIVCYLSLSFWGILGQKATIFLNTALRLKLFNLIMGSILIISAISLIMININT